MKKRDSNIQWVIALVVIPIILIFAAGCADHNDDKAAGTGIQSEEKTCVGGGDEPPINPLSCGFTMADVSQESLPAGILSIQRPLEGDAP